MVCGLLAAIGLGGGLIGCDPSTSDLNAVAANESVNLSWEPQYGARSYEVYVSEHRRRMPRRAQIAGITDTSVTVRDLENDKKYYFQVKARSNRWRSTTIGRTSATPTAPEESLNTATVKDTVRVVNENTDDWALVSANEWTLREHSPEILAGQVLFLNDTAVKIAQADHSSGRSVLVVEPAQLQDIFSSLDIEQAIDLDNARFEAPPSGVTTKSIQAKRIIEVGENKVVEIPLDHPPFSGSLALNVFGFASYKYDEPNQQGVEAELALSAVLEGFIQLEASDSQDFALDEVELGGVTIPVPLSVTDRALNKLGLRTAEIHIPLILGAEAHMEYAVDLRVDGSVRSDYNLTYDEANGLQDTGPTFVPEFSVTAGLGTGDRPDFATGSVSAGPYVRIRPALKIINEVASLGADVKLGPKLEGSLDLFLEDPFHCLHIQPLIQSEVFPYFKHIGGEDIVLATFDPSIPFGPAVTSGDCRNASSTKITGPLDGSLVAADGGSVEVHVLVKPRLPVDDDGQPNPTPEGSVQISSQGTVCQANIVNGIGQCELPISDNNDTQTIEAIYTSDEIYRGSRDEVTVSIGDHEILFTGLSCTRVSLVEGSPEINYVSVEGIATGPVGATLFAAGTYLGGTNASTWNYHGFPYRQECGNWTPLLDTYAFYHQRHVCKRMPDDPATTSFALGSAFNYGGSYGLGRPETNDMVTGGMAELYLTVNGLPEKLEGWAVGHGGPGYMECPSQVSFQ